MRMKKVLLGGVPGLIIVSVAALIAFTSKEVNTLLPLVVLGFCVCYIGMIVQAMRFRRREKEAAEAEERGRVQAAAQKKQDVEDILEKYK